MWSIATWSRCELRQVTTSGCEAHSIFTIQSLNNNIEALWSCLLSRGKGCNSFRARVAAHSSSWPSLNIILMIIVCFVVLIQWRENPSPKLCDLKLWCTHLSNSWSLVSYDKLSWRLDAQKDGQIDHYVTESLCSRGFSDYVNRWEVVATSLESNCNIQEGFYIKFLV